MNVKERLVICNEEDTDRRARVTADEERVMHVDRIITEQRSDCVGSHAVRLVVRTL